VALAEAEGVALPGALGEEPLLGVALALALALPAPAPALALPGAEKVRLSKDALPEALPLRVGPWAQR
jgi:hypothetical protein